MNKLRSDGIGGMYFTDKVPFQSGRGLASTTVGQTFDFAYKMTFGAEGQHRQHRSGGTHFRKQGEIFADTFQGKLAEFAVYNSLFIDFDVNAPDLDVWNLGKWDSCDMVANGKKIAIKSTKAFGQLLLLETKDWNDEGRYIPNIEQDESEYDIFILVRMKPFATEVLGYKLRQSDTADYDSLKRMITAHRWEYDIPGFITRDDLKEIIKDKQIIAQGALLNGKMPMDAENYYCQAIDMRPLTELTKYI